MNHLAKGNINNNSKSEGFTSFRYAVVIEYIGTSFAGSQIQPNQITVQSELESALKVITSNKVKTIFSGRTDSGVHSKGQVAHFDLTEKVNIEQFIYSLNALLPDDISVSAMNEVSPVFHSQKSALLRWYRYFINNKMTRSVWSKHSVNIRAKLDLGAMNKALSYLIGKHDFSSFKNANSANPAKECEMYYAKCNSDEGIIYIDLVANRFLYNMVRIIVGTLLKIGQGIFPAEYMLELLEVKDRTKAAQTVSPKGLFLMYVGYTKGTNVIELINKEANKDENLFCQAS